MTRWSLARLPLAMARFLCWALVAAPLAKAATAQTVQPKPEVDASATAIRCELRTSRLPDAYQPFYFYLSDARRAVLETDGGTLGNVVQYSRQRVVVSRNLPDGGVRVYTFDRMIGALTITSPNALAAPAASTGTGTGNSREPWVLSGECQQVDASRQKF
jgi:hypothetical protein